MEIKRNLKIDFTLRLVNRRQINVVKVQEGSPRWCALSFGHSEEAGQ